LAWPTLIGGINNLGTKPKPKPNPKASLIEGPYDLGVGNKPKHKPKPKPRH